ncbi:hypothetical protein, partial [Staphylococcus aureus]
TKTALYGDVKLNAANDAAKQTFATLTDINYAQRLALDIEIPQATNVEGVTSVEVKALQSDVAIVQLVTTIHEPDT